MKQEDIEESLSIADTELDLKIKGCMRMRKELDEIKNDPLYPFILSETKTLTDSANQLKQRSEDKERTMFISEVMDEQRQELKIKKEIASIKTEIFKNKLNDLTSEWVNEFQNNKGSYDTSETRERRDFISGSLNKTNVEEVATIYNISTALSKRFNRYVFLSVAAILTGAFVIFTTLSPPSGEKLFSTYYEPFQAISPVTRDAGDAAANTYVTAIKSYKSGEYEKAANGFEESSIKDPKNSSALFYLGLTDIERKDYSKAIDRLKVISGSSGTYAKEATWYLGLVYLKTGNIPGAKGCFMTLSGTDGFYKERSQVVLRRLK